MLFNSHVFLLAFLPVVLAGYLVLGRWARRRDVLTWLLGASLVFYGWWSAEFLALLLVSVGVNYGLGHYLGTPNRRARIAVLGLGIAANLGLLGYFKYAEFVVETLNVVVWEPWVVPDILLPLAISFFTFQQVAYLVDVYRGDEPERGVIRYALFVTFFPQLIAGPIVNHRETLPQFARDGRGITSLDVSLGLTFLGVGLFKKVVLADSLAPFANAGFEAAAGGQALAPEVAWGSTLAYTFQLYFDFSGYSDMAIGLGRLFGIKLPLNFLSPYKATNIVDFWRRWHMTLSRFLRDYLYIPLGGSRRGRAARMRNVLITMLLGGLWHGAAWTFVAWGALHGLYIVVYRVWTRVWAGGEGLIAFGIGRLVTFLAVVVAWVPFRADGFAAAGRMWAAMAGDPGAGSPAALSFTPELGSWLLGAAFVVWALPNLYELTREHEPALPLYSSDRAPLPHGIRWRARPAWALAMSAIFVWALLNVSGISEFLYYQF